MMINLGVGVQKAPDPRQQGVVEAQDKHATEVETVGEGEGDLLDKVERRINSAERGLGGPATDNRLAGEEDAQMETGQQDHPDISVLSNIIEDMYQRFNDDEINEMLLICGEVLAGPKKGSDEMAVEIG